jgi:hypothetical protein
MISTSAFASKRAGRSSLSSRESDLDSSSRTQERFRICVATVFTYETTRYRATSCTSQRTT